MSLAATSGAQIQSRSEGGSGTGRCHAKRTCTGAPASEIQTLFTAWNVQSVIGVGYCDPHAACRAREQHRVNRPHISVLECQAPIMRYAASWSKCLVYQTGSDNSNP